MAGNWNFFRRRKKRIARRGGKKGDKFCKWPRAANKNYTLYLICRDDLQLRFKIRGRFISAVPRMRRNELEEGKIVGHYGGREMQIPTGAQVGNCQREASDKRRKKGREHRIRVRGNEREVKPLRRADRKAIPRSADVTWKALFPSHAHKLLRPDKTKRAIFPNRGVLRARRTAVA